MTTTTQPKLLLPPEQPWFDPKTGAPTKEFALYLLSLDAAVRTLCTKI